MVFSWFRTRGGGHALYIHKLRRSNRRQEEDTGHSSNVSLTNICIHMYVQWNLLNQDLYNYTGHRALFRTCTFVPRNLIRNLDVLIREFPLYNFTYLHHRLTVDLNHLVQPL